MSVQQLPIAPRDLAFFGVEYPIYLSALATSLVIGFGSCFLYARIRGIKVETRSFITKSLLITFVIFLILSLFHIWLQSTVRY